MAWTNKQKATAAQACRAAGINDDQRRMILSGPMFAQRANHQGRPTSTSPRLTNEDFESFMSLVENRSGGTITLAGPEKDGYEKGYWERKAGDADHRLRWKIRRIANTLEISYRADHTPLLEPNGAGLRGWIKSRVTDRTDDLEQLTRAELIILVEGLKKYAARAGVRLNV